MRLQSEFSEHSSQPDLLPWDIVMTLVNFLFERNFSDVNHLKTAVLSVFRVPQSDSPSLSARLFDISVSVAESQILFLSNNGIVEKSNSDRSFHRPILILAGGERMFLLLLY